MSLVAQRPSASETEDVNPMPPPRKKKNCGDIPIQILGKEKPPAEDAAAHGAIEDHGEAAEEITEEDEEKEGPTFT